MSFVPFAYDVDAPSLSGNRPLTASVILPMVDERTNDLDNYNAAQITISQQTRLQVRLGELTELKNSLNLLIEANIENENMLERLFLLHDRIGTAIDTINNILPDIEIVQEEEKEEEIVNFPIEPESMSLRVSQMTDFFVGENIDYDDDSVINKDEVKIELNKESEDLFECIICCEEVPKSEAYKLSHCGHVFCKEVQKNFKF